MSALDRIRPDRRAWLIGGVLLGVVVLVSLAGVSLSSLGAPAVALSWIGRVAFAAAMIVFALGFGGRGSIVARGPLGVTALIAVGILPLVQGIVMNAAPFAGEQLRPSDPAMVVASILNVAFLVLTLAAAAVAVARVARAGVVPRPWHLAPLWAFALVVGAQLLTQVVAVAVVSSGAAGNLNHTVLLVLFGLEGLATIIAAGGLAVVAIVLALQPERSDADRSVRVFPPEA